jgi:hypothetical protein
MKIGISRVRQAGKAMSVATVTALSLLLAACGSSSSTAPDSATGGSDGGGAVADARLGEDKGITDDGSSKSDARTDAGSAIDASTGKVCILSTSSGVETCAIPPTGQTTTSCQATNSSTTATLASECPGGAWGECAMLGSASLGKVMLYGTSTALCGTGTVTTLIPRDAGAIDTGAKSDAVARDTARADTASAIDGAGSPDGRAQVDARLADARGGDAPTDDARDPILGLDAGTDQRAGTEDVAPIDSQSGDPDTAPDLLPAITPDVAANGTPDLSTQADAAMCSYCSCRCTCASGSSQSTAITDPLSSEAKAGYCDRSCVESCNDKGGVTSASGSCYDSLCPVVDLDAGGTWA